MTAPDNAPGVGDEAPAGPADAAPEQATAFEPMPEALAAAGATPRLYQRVYGIVAREIAEGAFPAGSRLKETWLASRFGISRAPARQALNELAAAGLIERTAGRGYSVRGDQPARHTATAPDNRPTDDRPTDNRPTGDRPTGDREASLHPSLTAMPSWERIYAEVEREIAARTSFASWRVIEAEMARHYAVSRTVIRDVLGRLQQRGVIQKDTSGRWFVSGLETRRITELYELRWVLEPIALAKATPLVPRRLTAHLRQNLEAALAAPDKVDGATLDRLEEELHIRVLEYCGSPPLIQAITLPQSLLIAHRFLYRWAPRLFQPEPFMAEHLAIVDRVEAGRAEEAADLMERHLKVSRDRALSRIAVIARQFEPDDLPYIKRV